MEKQDKKVAIIGANSILGQAIYAMLKETNFVYQVYHKNSERIAEKKNLVTIDDFLSGDYSSCDTIYYISAYIDTTNNAEAIDKLRRVNVTLVNDISHRFPKSKIIYASSVSVFAHAQILTEDSKAYPESNYAITKYEGEQLVAQHEGGGVAIRISSMFGAEMNMNSFIPLIAKQAITKNKITIFGDGTRQQNYISCTEAAAYFVASEHYLEKTPLLAVHKKSYSNLQIAEMISSYIGNVLIEFDDEDVSESRVYNNSYSRNKLGIKSEIDFVTELNRTVEWIRRQF